ncbi:MAG: LarC family nickel insertion protein [Pseudomonadota bacterium]
MSKPLHLHLDPLGGIAGDMFVAALLDAWPELAEGAIAAVRASGLGDDIQIKHQPHRDDVLTGSRFDVSRTGAADDSDDHEHVHWRDLRLQLSRAPLDPPVRERAIAIFALLAEAEAGVHGVDIEKATFHEVGAWDSIADIVAAAFLIEALGPAEWSLSLLPLGGGRVRSAHGELPVPAPATVRLLQGFDFHDDGRSGERVTPTGAAILKQLAPARGLEPGRSKRLLKSGQGFGLRKLDGMSNILRVTAFAPGPDPVEPAVAGSDSVAVLSFDLDDQTPEDLAIGLDRLRVLEGVLDLVQMPVFGKKGRMATSLRLLVQPAMIDCVIAACFAETTTLGIRWHVEQRVTLARHMSSADDGVAVKLAERPGGRITAKAESDGLRDVGDHADREQARRSAEKGALLRRRAEEERE